jgi:hypothetical protein
LIESFDYASTNIGRAFNDVNTSRFHCRHLFSSSALPARNNRACVSHTPTGRRSLSRDKSDNRFIHMIAHKLGSLFFGGAPDLAYHHNSIGLIVCLKKFQSIKESRSYNRIAADANSCRLSQTKVR